MGDAAGLADPITAEGIYYALESGNLCAQAISENLSRPQQACQSFQANLENGILRESRIAQTFARLLYFYPRMRKLAFKWKGMSLVEAITDVIEGKVTYTELVARHPTIYRLCELL